MTAFCCFPCLNDSKRSVHEEGTVSLEELEAELNKNHYIRNV